MALTSLFKPLHSSKPPPHISLQTNFLTSSTPSSLLLSSLLSYIHISQRFKTNLLPIFGKWPNFFRSFYVLLSFIQTAKTLLMSNQCNLCLPPMVDASEHDELFIGRRILVNGPVIVGAGPSGLAVAAGLQQQGVPFVVLERANCIVSLWQNKTYDRLKLHLPRQFCELPYFPFPKEYPEYPSKNQFINYLETYAKHFKINPRFNETVQSAKYDQNCGSWRIKTVDTRDYSEIEYICSWLVAATGENAEKVVPEFEGLQDFSGQVMHACDYKSGKTYDGKRVLVVGCGNSGMEISLDLCNNNAIPSMVIRSSVHVLPREILGISTFQLSVSLMKWLPIWLVDKILVSIARLLLGNLEKNGVKRPSTGPLQLKNTLGKTPVLDIGTLNKISSGMIKVVPGIKKFSRDGVELENGEFLEIDSVILATGYCSNIPSWLKENEFFSGDGFPKTPFPNGWKGKAGLYAVGFSRRGLSGASFDAIRVSEDIGQIWKQELKQKNQGALSLANRRSCKS